MQTQSQPILVLNTKTQREYGRKAQYSNIIAAKTIADVIRSCLGPSSMLKMLMDPMGGIVLTNDGNAILREVEVAHPAAKSMIELSRTQDEEVGDGTTSVIVLTGELLSLCYPLLDSNTHPIIVIAGLRKALHDALEIMNSLAIPIDVNDTQSMTRLIKGSINTKFGGRFSDLMCNLSLTAVRTIATPIPSDQKNGSTTDVDIKRYVRVEKIPGGEIEESMVLDGIILNKDVTHPKMRRQIANPRIILLDCTLEYKKGESQTNLELMKEGDWERVLSIEEEQIEELCKKLIELKPDLIFTEKGISDLAQHYFVKANVTAIRRIKKTDSLRIARAVGANIVNRVEDLKDSDVGTGCGMFHIEKIGDEYFTYLDKCSNPKACSIVLRGASKDILNELERDLQDALCVARNVYVQPMLVPGGGAIEMAVASKLFVNSRSLLEENEKKDIFVSQSLVSAPYRLVGETLEVIPRTLISNCGGDVIRTLTVLRAKHGEGHHTWGIDGVTGKIVDMADHPDGNDSGIWEPLLVKSQTLQTAVESACMLLRVDDIVSGVSKKDKHETSSNAAQDEGGDQD